MDRPEPPRAPGHNAVPPHEMREALESARRRLVEDRIGGDQPRSASELRAALREAVEPAPGGGDQAQDPDGERR